MKEGMGVRTLFSRKQQKGQGIGDMVFIFQEPVICTVVDDGKVANIGIDHLVRPDGMSGINSCCGFHTGWKTRLPGEAVPSPLFIVAVFLLHAVSTGPEAEIEPSFLYTLRTAPDTGIRGVYHLFIDPILYQVELQVKLALTEFDGALPIIFRAYGLIDYGRILSDLLHKVTERWIMNYPDFCCGI